MGPGHLAATGALAAIAVMHYGDRRQLPLHAEYLVEVSEGSCLLIGCRETGWTKDAWCVRCGAGPYHRECLKLHAGWCVYVYDQTER